MAPHNEAKSYILVTKEKKTKRPDDALICCNPLQGQNEFQLLAVLRCAELRRRTVICDNVHLTLQPLYKAPQEWLSLLVCS